MEKTNKQHIAELEDMRTQDPDHKEDAKTNLEHVVELEAVKKESKDVQEAAQDVVENLAADDTEQDAKALELEQREYSLFKKEVAITLKEHDLEMFEDVIDVKNTEQLNEIVGKLGDIVREIKVGTGYIPPKENAQQGEYDVARQNGDTKSMIKSLFGFGK